VAPISILVMVLPMKSFTGNLALIKFLQDGLQNKSQKSANASVPQFAEGYWFTDTMKLRHHWRAREEILRVWNRNI